MADNVKSLQVRGLDAVRKMINGYLEVNDILNMIVTLAMTCDEKVMLMTRIINMPRVDAAPVIRCKECKWRGLPACSMNEIHNPDLPKDDDFCSFAEGKKDDD